MDIIGILKQAKTSDVVNRVPDVIAECVKYEQLSRAERFRQFTDNDYMNRQFPILSELHNTAEWSVDQWKLGMVVYEMLIALGIADFFYGQTGLTGKLQSRRRDDMNMKTIVQFQIKDVSEFDDEDTLASVAHEDRIVLMTTDTMYVGAVSQLNDKDKPVGIRDVGAHNIQLLPDTWSCGLTLGSVGGRQVSMGSDAILLDGQKTIPRTKWEQASDNVDKFIRLLSDYQEVGQ